MESKDCLRVPCAICGMELHRNSLHKHVSNVHYGIGEHECNICSKKYSSKSNVNAHINRIHLNLDQGKRHNCPVCPYRATSVHT